MFSDDKWKIEPGAPDVSVEKELKNKKAAHWFDEPPGWQVGKFKKMYKVQKPDETGKKVITNYKWHFMNATHSSIFGCERASTVIVASHRGACSKRSEGR